MAHNETIQTLMETLQVAKKHHIGKIMAARGYWKEGTSSVNNAYKVLTDLEALKRLERRDGYFRVPGSRSDFKAHARILTDCLTDILCNYEAQIFREHYVAKLDRRADALVLIKHGQMGFCFLLEVVHEEKEEYLKGKIRSWREWEDATEYLANLFKVNIPYFEVIVQREGGSICQQLPSLE